MYIAPHPPSFRHKRSSASSKASDKSQETMLRGLTSSEAEESRKKHGSNVLSTRKKKSFWRQFFSNLGDPIIRILLAALVLNLLFSFGGNTDWYETGGIALAVFLATLISTLSEYSSESAFARLTEECGKVTCRIMRRSGDADHTFELPIGDVVVGDILLLEAGEMIPADGMIVSGRLWVDQSAMTGESREIEKYRTDPPLQTLSPEDHTSVFRGCTVLAGQGIMKVFAVGDATFLGHISEEVQEDKRESPLKRRLSELAHQISRLGYVAAALVGIIYLINSFLFDSGFDTAIMLSKITDWRYIWQELFAALTLGLTVLVVAVPEGLPMMIAVVLSSNIKKMVRNKVLVRKPVGIEAAGSMNLLFTDKTGTLTEGKLSVGSIYLGTGESFDTLDKFRAKTPWAATEFLMSCHANSSASLGYMGNSTTLCALGGNATDRALLDYVRSTEKPEVGNIIRKIPFDSTRKSSCAHVSVRGAECLYVKGAPERLLPYIQYTYRADGRMVPIDREAVRSGIAHMTETGERVLMIAVNKSASLPDATRQARGEWGSLILICFVVLKDKLRPEAPESVRKLKKAGIQVVMMTGDNKDTARAIASSCGILGGTVNRVLDSHELSLMSDEDIRAALPHIGVIARALPTDKSRLVRLAQASDLVVGMTGDGINDAPALKRADVGFAMGAGTQVAKDAGDIIIMDNNLRSITHAVLYGRTIFKSIRKFITLQLTMNLCAMAVTMICPFIGVDEPVTVVQMLWINLIMDTLGGLAFAGEAPLASYMEEPPKRRDEPILNSYMKHQILWLGGFTVGLCLVFLKLPAIRQAFRTAPNGIYILTAFFALFIFSSVFNCFNCRTDRLRLLSGLHRNKAFCLIMLAVLTIQILFVYLGGAVLRTAPLTAQELGLTFALSMLVFPAEFLRKVFWRLKGHRQRF